ncbi:MAG: complex I NDUFA9 subunit family protein [Rhodoferax sp.]|uniref:complex I NDUFA9 subunit family protein n=1 Tax=Rhodoferax sp. TaxID=50421 RepID=UPI00179AA32D|nr:complex I NDUFA9 subunit family protein [Rhodoferax sp.]NMM21571.1 complex I NDUFA9 subunit family protein [Rhodoferax sp.]
MERILVLGGSGFVGTHVCEKLVRKECHVTVPTRHEANARNLLIYPFLDVLEFDVHDEAALTRAVAGHDAVVNLIAILHGNQATFDKVHVVLPQKLARACIAGGVKKLVHISALGANALQPQSAPSMYLRSKGQGEAVLIQAAMGAGAGVGAQAGFDLTILRPSVIFGAEDKFLNLFASLQKVFPIMPLAGAHARFQPVWVEDVATAVVRSLERVGTATAHAPRIIEACGPDVFTLKELVQLSARLSGIREGRGRPVLALPDWLGRLQAMLMELAPGQPLMSRDNLASMQRDNVASDTLPGLQSLGITPSALKPIARDYLTQDRPDHGLLGIRQHSHH